MFGPWENIHSIESINLFLDMFCCLEVQNPAKTRREVRKYCRSCKNVAKRIFFTNIAFDTAENEPSKVLTSSRFKPKYTRFGGRAGRGRQGGGECRRADSRAWSGYSMVQVMQSILQTWGICTRRAGKLDRDGYRLYRSQVLQQRMRWN